MLQAALKVNESNAVVALSGRADTVSSECVYNEYEKAKENGCRDIKFDLENVEYICSATLRAFLKAQKDCNKNDITMCIVGASEGVKDVFEITGFSSIMNIV